MTKNEFWSKVEIRGLRECWPWIGSNQTRDGHALAHLRITGHKHHVHVCAWILIKDEIPPAGYHVHHKCKNKLCCNTLHLELLTAGEHAKLHNTKESAICNKCGGDKRHLPKHSKWVCDRCNREKSRNQTSSQREINRKRERNRYWNNKNRKIG